MKRVTVLVPVYNEAGVLEALAGELRGLMDSHPQVEWEVLMVDDGSSDSTPEMLASLRASDPRFNYLRLSRNFGKEAALLAGMDYASGDAVVILDADLQHPLAVVPEMVRLWQEEGLDDVYGRRLSRGRESWARKVLTHSFYRLLKDSSKVEMLPNVGDFRLLDRRCVNRLRELRETQRFTKGLYCWIGFRKGAVEYEQGDGVRPGSSHFNIRKLTGLAMDGLTGFSTRPLRIATLLGLLFSALSGCYLLWILLKTLLWGESVQGFPTLMCTILLLGGIQLLALGIIGEYVGRIYIESKRRPPYIPDRFNGEKL